MRPHCRKIGPVAGWRRRTSSTCQSAVIRGVMLACSTRLQEAVGGRVGSGGGLPATLEHVNVNLPAALVLLRPLLSQDRQLARLRPALEVLHGAGVGGEDLEDLAGAHAVDFLLGPDDRDGTLGPADIELSALHGVASPSLAASYVVTTPRAWRPRRTGSCRAPTQSPCPGRPESGPGWRGRSRHTPGEAA